jgi:hypothetical protein
MTFHIFAGRSFLQDPFWLLLGGQDQASHVLLN